MKPNINGVEVHPQLSNNDHPVDGAVVGAGSMWPNQMYLTLQIALKERIGGERQGDFRGK